MEDGTERSNALRRLQLECCIYSSGHWYAWPRRYKFPARAAQQLIDVLSLLPELGAQYVAKPQVFKSLVCIPFEFRLGSPELPLV